MRVLVAVWPTASHLYPVVPTAWALRAAGHDVRVASYPPLTESVLANGLTPVELGRDAELAPVEPPTPGAVDRAALDDAERVICADAGDAADWEYTRHRVLPVMALHYPGRGGAGLGGVDLVDELVGFARSWKPDLVLWDPTLLAAPIAARACGAAHARVLWGLDYVAWVHDRFARHGLGTDPITAMMEPVAERFGQAADREMRIGQCTFDLMPARMRFDLDLPSRPVRGVPHQRPTAVPDWLDAPPSAPRVCLTAGLNARERSRDTTFSLDELVAAAGTHDLEVVLTLDAARAAQLGTLPSNVRVVDYVPMDQLLPTCSAIVHHGGCGTFCTALAHGVPQLVTGALTTEDHGASAAAGRYVAERGAGLHVEAGALSTDGFWKDVERLVGDPSFADAATGLRAEYLTTPSPLDTVAELEELVAGNREVRCGS